MVLESRTDGPGAFVAPCMNRSAWENGRRPAKSSVAILCKSRITNVIKRVK